MLAALFRRAKGERKTNGDRMTEEAIDREREGLESTFGIQATGTEEAT